MRFEKCRIEYTYNIDAIDSPLPDRWGNKTHHGTISEMDYVKSGQSRPAEADSTATNHGNLYPKSDQPEDPLI